MANTGKPLKGAVAFTHRLKEYGEGVSIHIINRRCDKRFDAQVVTNKPADIIISGFFNLCPEVIVIMLLILGRHPHEDVVTYFVAFLESKAS